MGYNKVIMEGHLTRDIEVRYAANGTAIGNTGIATNRKYKNATGETVEEVTFVDITFFGRQAEIASQYLRKGSQLMIDGRLKLDQWTDQQGQKRSKHTIIVESMNMLGSRQDGQTGGQPAQSAPAQPAPAQPAPAQPAPAQPAPAQPAPAQPAPAQPAPAQPAPAQPAPAQPAPAQPVPEININEDEIPF